MDRNEELDFNPILNPNPKQSKILVRFSYNDLDFKALCTFGIGWNDASAFASYGGRCIEVNGTSEYGKDLICNIMTYPQCLIERLSNGESKQIKKSVLDAFYNALDAQE